MTLKNNNQEVVLLLEAMNEQIKIMKSVIQMLYDQKNQQVVDPAKE